MAEIKTKKNDASVDDFLAKVPKEEVRQDCYELIELMSDVTGSAPSMWGPSIIGFGSFHLRYASGREMDWMLTGFSPRKQNLSIYIMSGFDRYDELMSDLGKYKTGKSCLYVKRLDDIDRKVLRSLVEASVAHLRKSEKKQ